MVALGASLVRDIYETLVFSVERIRTWRRCSTRLRIPVVGVPVHYVLVPAEQRPAAPVLRCFVMILTIKSKYLLDGNLRYIQLRELAYREIERSLRCTSVKADVPRPSAERLAFRSLDEYTRCRHRQLTCLTQLRKRKRIILRSSSICPGAVRLYESS